MKRKMAWGLLLLACSSWARDPFRPLHSRHCPSAAGAELSWRLLGVIGREGEYNAWLIPPQGRGLRRQPDDPLPGSIWRISRIEAQAVILTAERDCQPPRRLELKGQYDDQDDWFVAGADKPGMR